MFYALTLLFVSTILAFLSANKQYVVADNSNKRLLEREIDFRTIAFVVLLIVLVCFAGLRTYVNDTANYMSSYEHKLSGNLSELGNINWSIGSNPLFHVFQIILKSVFSANAQMFIFVVSLITVMSMVLFIRKYADNFGFSMFIFLAFTTYAFTLAAMKQSMATAIGVWAMPMFLGGKRIRAVLLVLIAMLIHPYVLVLLFGAFLYKNIWDKRAVIIIVLTVIIGTFYTFFLENVLNFTSLIGEDYNLSSFDGNGVNFFRIAVYLVTPVVSFFGRERIRERNNRFLNLCVNFSLVSASFMIIAGFGGAVMLGRLANYLDLFTCISLPVVIACTFTRINDRTIVNILTTIGFIGYYIVFYKKYYPSFFGNMFSDFYNHVSIMEIFR